MESADCALSSKDIQNKLLFDSQNHEIHANENKNTMNNMSPDRNGDDLSSIPSNNDLIIETDTDDKCNSESVNNLESISHDSAKDQTSVSMGNVANTETLAEEEFDSDNFRNSRADFDVINTEDDSCSANMVNVRNSVGDDVTNIKGDNGTEDKGSVNEDIVSITNIETNIDDINYSDNAKSITGTETATEDINHSDNARSIESFDKDETDFYGSNIEASALDGCDLNNSTDNINDVSI